MNKLTTAKRTAIVSALIEGCSVRATARMVGVTKGAVSKLLVDLGSVCAAYHHEHVRNLTSQRIECDEIWAFVGAKRRTIDNDLRRGRGRFAALLAAGLRRLHR